MKEMLRSMMEKLAFPDDAKNELLDCFCRVENDSDALSKFQNVLNSYNLSMNCDYQAMLNSVAEIGEGLGIHKYSASLLMYLCMTPKLLERYLAHGYPEKVYYDSLLDLRYKLEECRLVYGINGSFAGFWFRKFFDLTRFALGRLQFELIETKDDFELNGMPIPSGSSVINVHIPRTGGRLNHEDVLDSYDQAARWFGDEFKNGKILFHCKSYLLDPWMKSALSPASNLNKFLCDFEIVKSGLYEDYSEVWRLFDCKFDGDASRLPRDSSLRCSYAERIERGEKIGWGVGIFLYEKND